jgi:hypothetical protein
LDVTTWILTLFRFTLSLLFSITEVLVPLFYSILRLTLTGDFFFPPANIV